MSESTRPSACDLSDGTSVRAYAERVLRHGTHEGALEAIHVLATAIGISALARDLGIPRERLCEAFRGPGGQGGVGPRDVLLAIACGRIPPN